MADAKTYKEIKLPKGAGKAFFEAMTAANDGNAPNNKKKTTAKKKTEAKKKK